MQNSELNFEKVKANAVSSYLLLFVSSAFLFNKNDPYLNNSFVKSHTKVALLIHLAIAITAIIFLFFGTWLNLNFLGYSIDQIIAITIFFILTWLLILWAIKANSWKEFKLWEDLNLYKKNEAFKLNSEKNINENDKLNIILSKVPFVWFFIYAKDINNKIIQNNTKLNLIITLIILGLYIFWNPNLANLLLLVYIIFIVFSTINLFTQNRLINFNLEKMPSLNVLIIYLKTIIKYLWNYFSNKKEFKEFFVIFNEIKEKQKERNKQELENLSKLNNLKLPKIIIYIPLLNFISLFNYKTKEKRKITRRSPYAFTEQGVSMLSAVSHSLKIIRRLNQWII